MATFTSKATGNWSASGQTTWNEVGVPANGDTVTIGTGHAITVNVNTTVGSSPAAGGTTAIRVNTTGTLTIAAGITLTCRGDILLNQTTLTMAAGSVLEFDASAAGTPSTALYVLQIGTSDGSAWLSQLNVNGSAGSRCTIRSNAGGGNGRVTSGYPSFNYGGNVDASYCDLLRIGDATRPSFGSYVSSLGIFSLQSVTMDACGHIVTDQDPDAARTFRLSGVTMKNTVASDCLQIGSSGALTTGTRLITGCVFDKIVKLYPPLDWTVTDTLFNDQVDTTNGAWASFSGNLLRDTTTGGHTLAASIDTCYVLADTATTNPHFLALNKDRNFTIDGCVFEYTGSDGSGDCVLPTDSASAPRVVTVKNCLVLPNAGGENSGTLVTLGGSANMTVAMEHNTVFAGTQGTAVGETYAGHAGLVSSFKNNLFWDTSARGYKLYDVATDDSVSNLVTSANANYNAGYNLLAGSNLKGYHHLEFSSGSPGANDVDGTNPTFVDSARDIAKWDTSLGGAGTAANALTELRKKNEAGYNTAYTIAALLTYVKAGFVPQAAALQAASDSVAPSNGWIGAVQGTTSSGAAAGGGVVGWWGMRMRRRGEDMA